MAFLKMKWNLNYDVGFVMDYSAREIWDSYHAKDLAPGALPPEPEEDGLTWLKAVRFLSVFGGEPITRFAKYDGTVFLRVIPDDCFEALKGGLKK